MYIQVAVARKLADLQDVLTWVRGKGVPWWGCSRKRGMECPSTAFGIETG